MPETGKALDPALREYLDEQAAIAPNLVAMLDPQRVKAVREGMPRALASRTSIPGLPNKVRQRDLTAAGRPARLYLPEEEAAPGPLPYLVYLHGGGWVGGTLATHDPFCCLLSEAAGIVILSVDYRQPPEFPYPAALDDALAAIHWAVAHAAEFGADPARLAVGGDSAGGNLAAAAVNRVSAESSNVNVSAQVLLYPATDSPDAGSPSYEENATGYGLTAEAMRWFWRQYGPGVATNDPDAFPLRRDPLPTLPPTLVATAGYDVLRDEGFAYAEKLRAAGVVVTHLHTPEMHHNFPVHPGSVSRFPQSMTALSEVAGWLRATLGNPLRGSLRTT